ncbi:MAG: hypothetical protein QQN41_04910 [Nitrosopumilus sp.]
MKAKFVYEAIGDVLKPKIITDEDYVKFFKKIFLNNNNVAVSRTEINDLSIRFGISKLKIRQILKKMGFLRLERKEMIGRIISSNVPEWSRSYTDKNFNRIYVKLDDLFMITRFINSEDFKGSYREWYEFTDLKTGEYVTIPFWPSQKSEYYFRLPTEEEIKKYNL